MTFSDSDNDGVVSSADIKQINHYYPFGLNMEGNWNGAQGNNKYQYNNKEWNDDFGLGWNDYGARFYDPSVSRWWNVDPLSEKYKKWSTYHYSGNNPLRFIDFNGKEWGTPNDEAKAKKMHKAIDAQIQANSKEIKRLDKKIAKWQAKIDAGATGKELESLEQKIDKANVKRSDKSHATTLLNTFKEGLTMLGDNKKVTISFNETNSSTNFLRRGSDITNSEGNKSQHLIVDHASGSLGNLFHETVHAIQHLTGGIEMIENSKYGRYIDIYDEVSAYSVQMAIDPGSVPNAPELFKEITPAFVKDIRDDNGKALYESLQYFILRKHN